MDINQSVTVMRLLCLIIILFVVIDSVLEFKISNNIEDFIKHKVLGVESPTERIIGIRMIKEEEKKPIGEKIGWMIGFIITCCLAAILIALTIKFIMWLF